MGIAPDRLILEDQSLNTQDNAQMTAAMLGTGSGTTLLVTSAFHMPRSIGLFARTGLDVLAWPTDYRSSGQEIRDWISPIPCTILIRPVCHKGVDRAAGLSLDRADRRYASSSSRMNYKWRLHATDLDVCCCSSADCSGARGLARVGLGAGNMRCL